MSRTDLRVALLLGLAHHPLAQPDKRVLRRAPEGVLTQNRPPKPDHRRGSVRATD